ncbi:MAG TPA: BlaI/MecI/CopY family transcriptional regulator [Longimicrobiaceae bacterium]|nr:BlaI/MecI/CopY family transcriptional regulator [Longimicrobiaceae bacterium]
MSIAPPAALSRRERQILDVLYRLGRATAAEVTAELSDAPTSTTVRGLLRILEEKGHVRHERDGVRYVYLPAVEKEDAGVPALSHVLRTFFEGSPSRAMAALLGSGGRPGGAELERLARLVEDARREGE